MRLATLALIAVSACGTQDTTNQNQQQTPAADPADKFVGTFSGVASRTLSCPDPGPAASGNISIALSKTGASELSASAVIPADSVGTTTTCGPITLQVSGSIATISGQAPCVATQNGSLVAHHTITEGTISPSGSTLSAAIKTNVVIDNTSSGSSLNCTAQTNGTMN